MCYHHDAIEVGGPPAGRPGPRRTGRERLMIETLEEGLSRLGGGRVRVRSLSAEELAKSTSFPVQRLDVRLESGEILPVIFKDLNPLRQLPDAKGIRRLELGRSRREIWMYRHVLPALALGTPQLYGYRWEPGRGNLWLFVEDVGRHRLSYRLDLALYEQAAAWAGRFHAAAASAPGGDQLLRYDRAHFERQGRHLEACLGRIAEANRPLVERALARHGRLTQRVDSLPHGIIHGEFFAKNVLLRRDQAATGPIAVIDWETAAAGPHYVDLVSISAGRWTRSHRKAMRRAYFDAGPATAAAGADWHRFNEEVDIVAFLQAVSWLGFWAGSDPGAPAYARHAERWTRELRTTMGEGLPA